MSDWVALITDTHAGIRGDSDHFAEYQSKFYTDIFFPKCNEYGVAEVFHLGDIFDRRKFINFKTLQVYDESFLKPLAERAMTMRLLVGNHDVFYKNTNKINSPNLLLRSYNNIKIFDDGPVEIDLGENKVLLVPWINFSNYDETMKTIRETEQNICFGHFEFTGFEMYAGSPSEEGMSTSGFEKFDVVCSGHFHHRSMRGNIVYLGAPFEYTWSDYNDERGFHLFNKKTKELLYVKNPYTMFEKIVYSDRNPDAMKQYINGLDIKGKIVKLIVQEKKDHYLFDRTLDKLSAMGPYELQVVDIPTKDLIDLTEEEIKNGAKDTMQLVDEYIDNQTDDVDLAKLTKTLMKKLHTESLSEE